MIQLYLSSDGKHTVNVSADSADQLEKLVPYAKELYTSVLGEFGGRVQANKVVKQAKANSQATSATGQANGQPQGMSVPTCPEHGRPLVLREGKWGQFWSCPAKLADGSWCTQTAKVQPSGNGQAVAA
jgi:hypothetical protein